MPKSLSKQEFELLQYNLACGEERDSVVRRSSQLELTHVDTSTVRRILDALMQGNSTKALRLLRREDVDLRTFAQLPVALHGTPCTLLLVQLVYAHEGDVDDTFVHLLHTLLEAGADVFAVTELRDDEHQSHDFRFQNKYASVLSLATTVSSDNNREDVIRCVLRHSMTQAASHAQFNTLLNFGRVALYCASRSLPAMRALVRYGVDVSDAVHMNASKAVSKYLKNTATSEQHEGFLDMQHWFRHLESKHNEIFELRREVAEIRRGHAKAMSETEEQERNSKWQDAELHRLLGDSRRLMKQLNECAREKSELARQLNIERQTSHRLRRTLEAVAGGRLRYIE